MIAGCTANPLLTLLTACRALYHQKGHRQTSPADGQAGWVQHQRVHRARGGQQDAAGNHQLVAHRRRGVPRARQLAAQLLNA